MNDTRRKAIRALMEQLNELRSQATELTEELSTIADEEQEYYDAMPENMQGGEKGEKAQASADALSNAKDALEGFESTFDEIDGELNTAIE